MLICGIELKKMRKSCFFDLVGLIGLGAVSYGSYLELGLGKALCLVGSMCIAAAIAKNWGE